MIESSHGYNLWFKFQLSIYESIKKITSGYGPTEDLAYQFILYHY